MSQNAQNSWLPLTAAQSGVWAAQQLDRGNPRYNCGSFLELAGPIDGELLGQAVHRALMEAEPLRVRLDEPGGTGRARQALACAEPGGLEHLDLSGAPRPRAAAVDWMRADLSRAVALTSEPLIRHVLIRDSPNSQLLYLRYHHLVMDGLGQSAHLRRVAELYTALVQGAEAPARRTLSLRDLVDLDAAYTASAAYERDRAFWLERFADRPDPVSLSDRDAGSARGLLRHATDLPEADAARLASVASSLGVRPSVLLIAAAVAYQCRMTGSEETLLRIPVAARPSAAAAATPAMFANALPVRFRAPRSTSFAQLAAAVSTELGGLVRHQRFRGEELHRELFPQGRRRGLAGTTVNVVTFDSDSAFGGLAAPAHHLSSGPVEDLQFDFFVDAAGDRIRLNVDANPALHSSGAPAAHSRRLLNLLRHALAEPALTLGRLPVMDETEYRAVLAAGAASPRDYELDRPLHQFVERQAARAPEAVAVQTAEGSLTYRELIDRSRRLAGELARHGVGRAAVVGVHQERSLDLVVSLLAVLMSGAAYLPLDPGLPVARIAFQIEDAGVGLVLSTSRLARPLAGIGARCVAVDQVLSGLPEPAQPLPAGEPADTAYVIYTSGSTGTPKGVAVPHRGIVNRLLWMQEEYGLRADECVLQKTPFTFDVSVWEFFWPLIAGARLHLAEPDAHRDPRALAAIIAEYGVTTTHFVPPMLDLFLAEPAAARLPSLRRVVCSGEALRPETVARFFAVYGPEDTAPGLFNLYGPTEASIDVTHWRCTPQDADRPVPIGRAVANTSLYVLDPGGAPLPFGVPGELHVGGVQVATGYLARPELTAERFVRDPFDQAGGRLYRTGDLAVLGEDGVVAYLGRLDEQVKVRGFRVEPGEIESALLAVEGVRAAVVTAPRSAQGLRQLVAHVVAPGADVERLTAALAGTLPEYMVPSHIVLLEALPLSPSGKVDRKALPEPASGPGTQGPGGAAVRRGPRTPAERLVYDAFAEVLGSARVEPDTSFFALGGDSILSIRMRAALERAGHTFALSDLYDAPTVRTLTARIRPLAAGGSRPGPFSLLSPADRALLPEDVQDAYPLTSMQAAMAFHAGYEEGSSVYRVVSSVRVRLPFEEQCMRRAVDAVVRRHPALRSSVHLTGYSEPLQLVHRDVDCALQVDDHLRGARDEVRDRALADWADAAKHRDFELAAAPLLAFTVHTLSEGSFQLGAVEHHVVLDGWSDAAMLDEIVTRYRAALYGEDLWLAEPASAFRDFVAAEREAIARAEHREFWARELAGAEPTPLPARSGGGETGPARHRRFEVPVTQAAGLRIAEAARNAELPLKALLGAVHVAVLNGVIPGEEVVTGVIAHGRLEVDGGDEAIGVFLNTLPMRIAVADRTWLELAKEVQAHEQRSVPHRRYPYARILREHGNLSLDSYVNFMDFHLRWGSDGAIEDGFGVAETEFPLAANFLIDPVHGRLALWLDCDTALLDEEFCERLAGYYARALETVAADPCAIATSDLRGPAELALLRAWNDTAVGYDASATVHGLIARQAAATPSATAVLDGRERLSYGGLDERANRLAHHLRALGVGRGSRVGVSVNRSADLVVTLLAVARSGAAYVPMDPGFPAERLRYIAEDAALDGLVLGPGVAAEIPAKAVVRLDRDAAAVAARPAGPLDPAAGAEDQVYVMYTSGSTGKPKGTMVSHRNVVNFFTGMDARIGIGAHDVVLALTSVSFDISVLELLWPLTRGACVAVGGERMIERLARADGPDSFAELVGRHGATLVQATPSFMAAVAAQPEAIEALRALRALLVGGEAFPSGLADRLLAALPSVRVFNMYGPTETTIWSTVHELDCAARAAVPPIGRPIANTLVRVAAPGGAEVPIGVAGELWIGGDGVAAGYLNRPELTAQRFVETAGGRFYRTGDRVRRRGDGSLEFLGRLDRQVKILGHRVEPDEVESVLSRHPALASVAVVAAQRPGRQLELVAYVAPRPEAAGGQAESAHLDRWRDVWDGAYTSDRAPDEPAAEPAQFAGWLSSYTGRPIPPAQMREWLTRTVDRIRAAGTGRIVDVGVGVGLYLRMLAPTARSYLGVDVSAAALASAADAVRVDGRVPERITLRQGDASILAGLPDASADLVLFNSVVQYFPSAEYLRRALTEAVRVAGARGAVFVGDVRDLGLLPAFHADTQLRRAPALGAATDVAAAAARALAEERELCLTTEFFAQFAAAAGLGLEIELKRGRSLNELTRFRWDATLFGAQRRPARRQRGPRLAWDETGGLEGLEKRLALAERDAPLTVAGLPNRRLVRPLAALRLSRARHVAGFTAWDLERAVWACDEADAIDPEDVAVLGERCGRGVRLVPAPARPGEFDAVFEPAGAAPLAEAGRRPKEG